MNTVLLIEDDALVGKIYSTKLAAEGFTAELAKSGAEGIEKAKTKKPDIVLLDLMLPDIQGTEVMKAIRALPELASIPIVVLSNAYLPEMIDQAWKAGANEVLTKSRNSPRQVVEVLKRVAAEFAQKAAPVVAPPVPPRTPAPETPPRAEQSGTAFEADLRDRCAASAEATIDSMRGMLSRVVGFPNNRVAVADLFRSIHSLTTDTWMMGLPAITMHAAAVEALLKKIHEKPDLAVASVWRTVAQAIDVLRLELARKDPALEEKLLKTCVLLVDDDNLILKVNAGALEKSNVQSVTTNSPTSALDIVSSQKIDLIILDISMPEMDGFELCEKIRCTENYSTVPIIFMTSHSDFDHQVKAALKGGTEFVSKPCHPSELAVKALTMLIKRIMS